MVDLVKRLKEFLDHKRLGVVDLAQELGYSSPKKLYRLFNTENAWPSCQIIQDLGNRYPELNLNWLLVGTGAMTMNELEANLDYKEKYYSCLEEKSWIATKCLEEKERSEKLTLRIKELQG